MATVNYASFSWFVPGEYFPPGGIHNWWMTGFEYGDALSVTAHSVTGNPFHPHRILKVDDVRIDGTPDEPRLTLRFQVRNVGAYPTPGYAVGVGWISG